MDPDILDAAIAVQLVHARIDVFLDARLRRRTRFNDTGLECELEISRVLVVGINPSVPDEQALELGRYPSRLEDGVGDVGDVLAGVGLSCDPSVVLRELREDGIELREELDDMLRCLQGRAEVSN